LGFAGSGRGLAPAGVGFLPVLEGYKGSLQAGITGGGVGRSQPGPLNGGVHPLLRLDLRDAVGRNSTAGIYLLRGSDVAFFRGSVYQRRLQSGKRQAPRGQAFLSADHHSLIVPSDAACRLRVGLDRAGSYDVGIRLTHPTDHPANACLGAIDTLRRPMRRDLVFSVERPVHRLPAHHSVARPSLVLFHADFLPRQPDPAGMAMDIPFESHGGDCRSRALGRARHGGSALGIVFAGVCSDVGNSSRRFVLFYAGGIQASGDGLAVDDWAVRVVGLGKRYRIAPVQGYVENPTLREVVSNGARQAWASLTGRRDPGRQPQTFWALRSVDLEVERGSVLGLIGRNGAGKSTLLKILSRVLLPTEGYAEVRGRLGSLLEVGTGFHPDLTGRENIYLNAAVMGMRRSEVEKRLEEILAFSEIGDFVDTPVKYYSSGMYVRLAFSVAAYMDPDILIVDEVLSVGDISFQKKSFDRMRTFLKDGKTVLVVSHSMEKMRQIADTVAWIDHGRLRAVGKPEEVCRAYEKESISGSSSE
jgi:ABC-type polysaccharide/polyol phosphate transport system ATPase subunit